MPPLVKALLEHIAYAILMVHHQGSKEHTEIMQAVLAAFQEFTHHAAQPAAPPASQPAAWQVAPPASQPAPNPSEPLSKAAHDMREDALRYFQNSAKGQPKEAVLDYLVNLAQTKPDDPLVKGFMEYIKSVAPHPSAPTLSQLTQSKEGHTSI